MLKKREFIFIVCLFGTVFCWSQQGHPFFRNYTTDDGLPSSEVHAAIEDSQGYMWFATDNGLSRFNGYEFKNYGPREGLKHNVALYLQKDKEGRIWVATLNGCLYFIEQGRINEFSQNDWILEKAAGKKIITDFYIDDLGMKYVSIRDAGILKFYPDGNKELLVNRDKSSLFFSLPIGDRWMVGGQEQPLEVQQKVWKESAQSGLFPMIEIQKEQQGPLLNCQFAELVKHGKGVVPWMLELGHNRHLILFNKHLFEVVNDKIVWSKLFPLQVVQKSIFKLEDGKMLIGSGEGLGLREYANIEKLKAGEYRRLIPNVSVNNIFKDSKGALWVTTLEDGIFYCPDIRQNIFDESTGLSEDHVNALDFGKGSELYVGLNNREVFKCNIDTWEMERLPTLPGRSVVNDIFYHKKEDILWVTTNINSYLQDGKWKGIFQESTINKEFYVINRNMSVSPDEKVLWGANYTGFGAIDLEQKKPLVISRNLGLEDRSFSVMEDRKGSVWVGLTRGLFQFKEDSLIRPAPFFPSFDTRVEDLDELQDGTLVIGTKGEGVLLWKDSFFLQITLDDGLTSDMIENVFVDEAQNIWVGTLQGLNQIIQDKDQIEIRQFTTWHGLPSNEINEVKVKGEDVWLGTSKGIVQWKIKEVDSLSRKPFIEAVFVNNEKIRLNKEYDFSHEENSLVFHFLTINFNSAGKVKYQFRLNEESWKQTESRSVNLAKLSPGQYLFEIQSMNENGIWSPSETIEFKISPPFWKTAWFLICCILIGLALLYWLYQNRIQRLQAEANVKLEMDNLKNSALRAQMNPHFIFNCLNSIQNLIHTDDKANASKYLVRFAKLIRATLNASNHKLISLEDEVNLLKNYLELEKLRFKKKFDFYIDIPPEMNSFDIEIPPLLIQTYVENAIVHGFSGLKRGGKIKVTFRENEKSLSIKIEDNGIGIFHSQNLKKENPSSRNSYGMSISQKRMALLDKNNIVNIEEIKGENNEVLGTVVSLKIHKVVNRKGE